MTESSAIGRKTKQGDPIKSKTNGKFLLLCVLICLSIPFSTATTRYGRSRDSHTRSTRTINEPNYIHLKNQSNEKDGRYLSLVHILSKLAMNVPKGYPVSSTEEESPLERYKQRRYQKHATGNNEMAEEFGQDKLLTSGRNLGPFAMLYALQSSVPERNPSMEGVDGITRRSSDRSSRWRKWFWNGGRATGIRLTK